MILPVQTTFHNVDHSEAVIARIQEEADKLETYFDRITSCRVVIEAAHRHRAHDEPFHIRIELGVPGKELVVAHEPASQANGQGEEESRRRKCQETNGAHKDIYVAIRDSFRAMRRQLQDYVECLRS
jgi:ribosome-associated translation inhibitor RaiA